MKSGQKCGNSASITREIKDRLPDSQGNHYPPRDKCYITVSKTANSSAELAVVYLKKVLFPAAGVNRNADEFPKRMGVLCDDFRGHSAEECKNFTTGHPEREKMLHWSIMKGGLTPVAQPLDKVVNKVFKGYLRDIYDQWSLTAPVNATTGAPMPPSRQQMASWVVEAWEKIPEELCAKAWTACGYKTKDQLCGDKETGIVAYTDKQVGKMIQDIIGNDDYVNFGEDGALVGADPEHPEEGDLDYSDVES